jgi:hypothetical protein
LREKLSFNKLRFVDLAEGGQATVSTVHLGSESAILHSLGPERKPFRTQPHRKSGGVTFDTLPGRFRD